MNKTKEIEKLIDQQLSILDSALDIVKNILINPVHSEVVTLGELHVIMTLLSATKQNSSTKDKFILYGSMNIEAFTRFYESILSNWDRQDDK